MAKTVELDKELEQAPEVEYPELPLSCATPTGWARFCVSNACECWYQEALQYEAKTGFKIVPLSMNEKGYIELNKKEEGEEK